MNALETPLEAAELQQLACDLQVDDRIVLRFKKEAAKKIVEWRGYVQVARGSGDNRHVGTKAPSPLLPTLSKSCIAKILPLSFDFHPLMLIWHQIPIIQSQCTGGISLTFDILVTQLRKKVVGM